MDLKLIDPNFVVVVVIAIVVATALPGLLLVLFLVKVMHDNVQYILNLKLIDPNFVVVVNAIGVATATTALEKISVVGTKINKYGM